jgi:Spy/CpxP family protein refolding chaperone
MHPGFHRWWRARHGGHETHPFAGCGGGHSHGEQRCHEGPRGAWAGPSFDEGGVLGVRRPLRFLAYKLDLTEPQVATLAAILDELKTERAQASVDQRRRISALAEAIESASFDDQRIAAIGEEQKRSDDRIREAVARALRKLHEALDEEQRKRLAYLLRTGALTL